MLKEENQKRNTNRGEANGAAGKQGEIAILDCFEPDLEHFSCDRNSSTLLGKLDKLFYDLNGLITEFLD